MMVDITFSCDDANIFIDRLGFPTLIYLRLLKEFPILHQLLFFFHFIYLILSNILTRDDKLFVT